MTLGWIVWHMMLQLTNSAKQMSLFHFLWKRMQRHIFWYVWFKNFLPFTDMVQVVLDVEVTLLIEWIQDNPDWFEFPFLSNSFNMAATSTAHSRLLCSQLLACNAMLPVWHAKRKLQRRLCSFMLSFIAVKLMGDVSIICPSVNALFFFHKSFPREFWCLNTTSYHNLRWFIPKDFFVSQARHWTQKTKRAKNQVTSSTYCS